MTAKPNQLSEQEIDNLCTDAARMSRDGDFHPFFKPGVVLLREVVFENGQAKIAPLPYTVTPRKNHQYRVQMDRFGSFAPVVVPDGPGQGVVLYVNGTAHENWTHCVVKSCVSRPGRNGMPGGNIVAEYATPYDLTKYLAYRTRIRALFVQLFEASKKKQEINIRAVLREAVQLTPPERRSDEGHLVSVLAMNNQFRDYTSLTWDPEEVDQVYGRGGVEGSQVLDESTVVDVTADVGQSSPV